MPFDTNPLDAAVRSWIVAHQTHTGLAIAAFVSEIGSVGPMRWVAMLAAVFFFARGRGRATLSAAIAPWLALGVYAGTRRLLPRTRPPGAAGYHEMASSFPSAHATTSAAVCCTLAYLLWREHMLNGRAALALAVVPPLCIGVSRLYLDVHWTTDVLAGWFAGVVVAVVACSFHRLLSARAE
jgi:membrane-associated phospholipid phosphatase